MSSEENDQDGQDTTDAPAESLDGNAGDQEFEGEFTGAQAKQPMGKGSVAMFILLAAAGAGTYFMYARTGPQSASAAADPKAQAVISQFMSDRDKNLGTMRKMLRDTEAVVKQFLNYPSVKQVPLSGLTANPFRMVAASAATPSENPKKEEEREKKLREEERLAVLKSVNALQLQSVMHSDKRKACMINNTMYGEGEMIESFTIEKISPNSVIVRNGSYRFELRMQR
jgi:hypothetical protein